MDRLEAMSLLVEAVDAGSLSGAGRRLGMPLASVSRKISDLEAHLKTRLLIRSTRHIALTDAGRDYVAAAKRILEEVGEAERTAAGEYRAPKGDLAITAPVVFGRIHVLPVVIEFLRAYPEIDVRLELSDRLIHLLEDRVDLALRIGELPDSSFVALRIGAVRPIVCASPEYLRRKGVPQTPEDLAAHDCVTFEGLAAPALWTFAGDKEQRSVPVHSRLTVTTAQAAMDAAIAGLGLTRLLSYQVEAAAREGLLALVLESFAPTPWPIHLVHAGGQGRAPLKLRAFLDFAAPRLKARLTS